MYVNEFHYVMNILMIWPINIYVNGFEVYIGTIAVLQVYYTAHMSHFEVKYKIPPIVNVFYIHYI